MNDTKREDDAGRLASELSDPLGLEPERAFEAWAFDQPDFTTQQPWDVARAAYLAGRAAERERLKAIAHRRAGYEAAAAAHHAGKWQPAFEKHTTRNAAMCDLIDALFGPNVGIERHRRTEER